MPTSFHLLSPQIQKFVYESGWDKFRPIQEAAINYITQTQDNYILSAATASGKTEAAFLPILSLCYPNGYQENSGVKILYISPLIALINDQFGRTESLCKYLDIKVTKWHGEASLGEKKKLIQNPQGIVLITPESIEALFCNKPTDIKQLFKNVEFVVIDEIHSFLETERGTHLQSLLFRLQEINPKPIRFVGLSATLGDYNLAKRFFGNPDKTKILKDSSKNQILPKFKYFGQETADLTPQVLTDLYQETQHSKSLIFPNSKGKVEEIAVKLKAKAKNQNAYHYYFAHHSSIEKEDREQAEIFAKTNQSQHFSIICTSTLELGIDIGSIDKVIQVGEIFSISSLSQRLGRSGRRTGISNLVVYSLDQWQLLQNIASFELLKEGFLEPSLSPKRYDILVQQILSILKETSGITKTSLVQRLKTNWAFQEIEVFEMEEIINHLIKIKLVQDLGRELILGIEAQYVVTGKDFYAVFQAKKDFKVFYKGKSVGELEPPKVGEIFKMLGENVFLSASIWKIVDIDIPKKKFYVSKTNDGKAPIFTGKGGEIHTKVRQKMLQILLSSQAFDYIDTQAKIELQDLRNKFKNFTNLDTVTQRPYLAKDDLVDLYLFIGSKLYTAIEQIVKFKKNQILSPDANIVSLSFKTDLAKTLQFWQELQVDEPLIDTLINDFLTAKETNSEFTKYSTFLPLNLQIQLFKDLYYDLPELLEFLDNVRFVWGD